MKKFLLFLIFSRLCLPVSASMFDDDGNYTDNWKQMTNVPISTNSSQKYSSSSYSTYNWKKSQQQVRQQRAVASETNAIPDAMPFRYNTLDYTRVRKVKGGYGDYSARCMDIGDASFCH